MKTLNKILSIGALAVLGFVGADLIRTGLIRNDLNESKWKPYDNKSGEVWSSYMGEDIPHSSKYWEIYQDRVKKVNDGRLTGEISLPDVDGNGKVGNYDNK